MEEIKIILNEPIPTMDDLIYCFELVKDQGDVAFIKLDGQRSSKHYTIFITFSDIQTENNFIREDGDNLRKSLINILSKYIEYRSHKSFRG